MHIIRCDICDAEATRSANPINVTSWPDGGGSTIEITFNQSTAFRRTMTICPACTRKNGFPERNERISRATDERDDLIAKVVDMLIDDGYEQIRDIARDCMED